MASSHSSALAPRITPINDLLIPNSSQEAGEGGRGGPESVLSKPDWDLMGARGYLCTGGRVRRGGTDLSGLAEGFGSCLEVWKGR